METAVGRPHGPGKHVILTVATDCAIGKMSVALELRRAAEDAGLRGVFVPTGQTGMMIEGWGVAVDRLIVDFLQGTTEPGAMVMVHKPGLVEHDFDHLPGRSFPIASLPGFIRLHEQVAGLVAPSRVVAVALNTSLLPDEAAARRAIAETAELTGLPTDDPFRFGGTHLFAAIRSALEGTP